MAKKKKEIMKLAGLYKIYVNGEEKVYALDNVDLKICSNDFISILGPSGSGKSTLLHMLGLLDRPTKGKILLDGMDTTLMKGQDIAYLRGKKIGFIFQMFNLIPSLTVLENVALPAIIYEEDEEEAKKKAMKILEEIDMKERSHHYPNQLSGGQRQRAAIARALINDPEIILADEPTGNLDTKTGNDVLNMFREFHKKGKTLMIVTHDKRITKITDRTIRIVDGKIAR